MVNLRIASTRLFHLVAAAVFSVQGYAQEAPEAPASARLETVAVVSDQAPVKAGDRVVATVEKGRMFGVIERRGDRVEIQVCVGSEIRRGSLRTSDVKFLTDADVDLAAEWLKMSKDLNPKLDLPAYKAKLDALVERVAAAVAEGKTPRGKARLIGVQLFEREGFSNDYEGLVAKRADAWRADRLLDLKRGTCFSFSLLYLCIARRLKMSVFLVVVPGHVFVRYEDGSERFSVETTAEGTVYNTDYYLADHNEFLQFSQLGGMHLWSLPGPRAFGALVYVWGQALAELGRHAEACEKCAKAVEINPRLAEAYYNWGAALAGMGKHAEACEKFAKAVEINPRDAEAYSGWGYALGEMGKHEEACEKYAKVVEINPRDANAYYNWGLALGEMGKLAEPGAKYAKAVEINPRDANAHFNWGDTLVRMGKHAEACEKYAKAAECDPQDARAYTSWGRALERMGKYGEACQKYAKVVQISPRSAEGYFDWGAALACLGQNGEAIEKLEKAAELDPTLRPKVEDLRKELGGKK